MISLFCNEKKMALRASNGTFAGTNLYVIGDNNTVTGPHARVHGNNNTVTGPHCVVVGDNNEIVGPHCVATGNNNTLHGPQCKATGRNNTIIAEQDTAVFSDFIVGHNVSMSVGGGGMTIIRGHEQSKKKSKKKKEKFVEGPVPADAEHDRPAKEGEATCIICLEHTPCCIAAPCNHLSFCVSCARSICFTDATDPCGVGAPKKLGTVSCPQCRADVASIKRVFY